jgi:hypothetical protein
MEQLDEWGNGLPIDTGFLKQPQELDTAVLAALHRRRATQRVQSECHVLPDVQ